MCASSARKLYPRNSGNSIMYIRKDINIEEATLLEPDSPAKLPKMSIVEKRIVQKTKVYKACCPIDFPNTENPKEIVFEKEIERFMSDCE